MVQHNDECCGFIGARMNWPATWQREKREIHGKKNQWQRDDPGRSEVIVEFLCDVSFIFFHYFLSCVLRLFLRERNPWPIPVPELKWRYWLYLVTIFEARIPLKHASRFPLRPSKTSQIVRDLRLKLFKVPLRVIHCKWLRKFIGSSLDHRIIKSQISSYPAIPTGFVWKQAWKEV
jgi:hypothetical protein